MTTTPQAGGREGRGVILGLALVAGLALAMGPLLGAVVSVVQVLRVYAAAAARGDAPAAESVRFPIEPVVLGFAAFLPGLLLLTLAVMGYSRRVRRRRLAGLD
jgi:hypothetical protein